MECDALKILSEHEEKATQDLAKRFSISLSERGILLKPDKGGIATEIELPQDLLYTLTVFFNDSQSIPYLSEDYNTLRSLLSAHACLTRMKNK